MVGYAGISSGSGVGEFPLNLVGKEMVFWRVMGLPYPEEICVFWNEAMALRGFTGWGSGTYFPAMESLLHDMGLDTYEREWFFTPANYHAGLRGGRKDMQVTRKTPPKVYPKAGPRYTAEEAADYASRKDFPIPTELGGVCACDVCTSVVEYRRDAAAAKKDAKNREDFAAKIAELAPPPFDLGLTPPNPPRIAQIQVLDIDRDGQKTVYPLTSISPSLLKEYGEWKYGETVTINSTSLDRLIRELVELKWRLDDQGTD